MTAILVDSTVLLDVMSDDRKEGASSRMIWTKADRH